jgi:hypothetical protein
LWQPLATEEGFPAWQPRLEASAVVTRRAAAAAEEGAALDCGEGLKQPARQREIELKPSQNFNRYRSLTLSGSETPVTVISARNFGESLASKGNKKGWLFVITAHLHIVPM